MSVTVSDGPAIVAGYAYQLQIESEAPLFPAGCTLVAHVRTKVSDTTILATLSTDNRGLVRLSDSILEIRIPATATVPLKAGSVVMDVVRTDVDPDRHLNFSLEIPVIKPVTRGV